MLFGGLCLDETIGVTEKLEARKPLGSSYSFSVRSSANAICQAMSGSGGIISLEGDVCEKKKTCQRKDCTYESGE